MHFVSADHQSGADAARPLRYAVQYGMLKLIGVNWVHKPVIVLPHRALCHRCKPLRADLIRPLPHDHEGMVTERGPGPSLASGDVQRMKNHHFSFRGGTRNQEKPFISSNLTDRISALVHGAFDPYGDYGLSYGIYFINAISDETQGHGDGIYDIFSKNTYFGRLDLVKNVDGEMASYAATREIEGISNQRNTARPTSTTRYHHDAANDEMCTILPGCTMHYCYEVTRNYYNRDLRDVYRYNQKIHIDKGGTIAKYDRGRSIGLETSGAAIHTNFTLMDLVQKLSIAGKAMQVDIEFDYFENMEVVKRKHNIRYVDAIKARIGNKDIGLTGYCHTGTGIMPTFYWVTDRQLLIMIRYGISFIVLEGGDGNFRPQT